MLKENERIDDLLCRGYRIIQDPNGYCFTSDSVLLANLAVVKNKDRVVDLCTGSGVIALLINAKYSPKTVIGAEIQPRLADMAARSVALNGAENSVTIVNASVIGLTKLIGSGYDVVTANPPYEPVTNEKNATESDVCKTEISLTAEELIAESAKLLRFGGSFYMVHRTRRMAEIILLMSKYGIEPKKIYLVYPKKGKNADTFIVEGKRGGKSGLLVPPPIVVYDENGDYTPEVRSLYNK